jgi:hypothetical protein
VAKWGRGRKPRGFIVRAESTVSSVVITAIESHIAMLGFHFPAFLPCGRRVPWLDLFDFQTSVLHP